MAYYFMVSKKRGEYTPIDITKSKYFMRTSKLKGAGMTLEEIDMFTMMFNDEQELRMALFNEGLLKQDMINSPLSARILRNKEYFKVMYDFLYQKDMEYVLEPARIIKKINDKLMNDDFRFVLSYANTFAEFHDCSSTAPEVRAFASESIKFGRRSNEFNFLDEENDNPLVRMTKLLIYQYEQYYNGRVEYQNKIKYRNLHMVIAFVNNYDKKYVYEEIVAPSKDDGVKKKIKKNDGIKEHDRQIPGQINLFD